MKFAANKNAHHKLITKYFVIFILQNIIQMHLFGQALPSIQTDRPDQTESPFTVPKKHFQIETGISFERIDGESYSYTHPTVLLKYGVNDIFELRLIPEFVTSHTQSVKYSGINPIIAGFKVKLAEEKGILPMLSFIGHLSIPDIASKNFKTTWYAPSFRFTMQHTLSQKVSLGYNLGAEWNGETPEPAFIYTLTTGYSISERLGSYIELYGFFIERSTSDQRLDGGLSYFLKKNMMLDISGGLGINKYAPEYYAAIGFSIRLKN